MNEIQEKEEGTLYIVATPIGNLADMTFRGVETLENVDLIACEDTRVTRKLLDHYEITVPTTAIHHHSKEEKLLYIVEQLKSGKNIAYVSDAGTPGISDPGNQLVAVAVENNIDVVPIPGASALGAIVSVAGIDLQRFTFLAYPPHKKGRHTFFEKVSMSEIPVIYYDSVHRVVKNLKLLQEKKPDAQVIVGRELTKMFEEIKRGSAEIVIDYFESNPQVLKGEFVVIVL